MRQRKWIPGTPEHRAHMAEYMRQYRAGLLSPRLQPKSAVMVVVEEYQKAKKREADRTYYLAHRAEKIARSAAYQREHRAQVTLNQRNSRLKHRKQCQFCGALTDRYNFSCLDCLHKFGHVCRKDEVCGVVGRHKHCARCSMPVVVESSQHGIRECEFCLADAKRGACMDWTEDDTEEIAA